MGSPALKNVIVFPTSAAESVNTMVRLAYVITITTSSTIKTIFRHDFLNCLLVLIAVSVVWANFEGGLTKLGCPSWWWVNKTYILADSLFISMIKRRERKGRESQREREGGNGGREGGRKWGREKETGGEGASGREKGGLGEVQYNGSTYGK